MFKYRWCIYPKRRMFKMAPSIGRLGHKLFELGPEGVERVREEVYSHVERLEAEIDKGGDIFGDIALTIQGLIDAFNKALVMVNVFWDKYPVGENYKALCKEKHVVHEVELPNGIKTKLSGTIDEILQNLSDGAVWNRDHKLSSRPAEHTLAGYKYSAQCRQYRVLAEAEVGQPIHGFVLNILQVPSIKLCSADKDYKEYTHTFTRGAKKGQTEQRKEYYGEPKFENYLKRCKEWYEENGQEAAHSYSIQYGEPIWTPEFVELISRTHFYMNQQDPHDPLQFHRDQTRRSCTDYNRICDYYPLCRTNPASWGPIIEQDYEVVPLTEGEYVD
jgi:hypothetical protein